jgi:uncharacterized protein (TIGR03435 family)
VEILVRFGRVGGHNGKMHADDMNLVREYAANGSEAAFATLVQRHVNLVYSAALRQLGNAHEAEEVAQAVFIILARKAGSLRPGTILSGWLYQTAQLTAANFRRTTLRRQRREQEAFMQFSEHSQPDVYWHRLAPLLEQAMSRLGQKERDAVVMRYFENCTVREVAAALGVREDAAQKRVNRGTEKLREYFVRRGIQVSTAALLTSIGTHAVQAAPTGLANAISAVALAKGAAASGSTLTLIKGALKVMAWTKAKTAIVVGAGILLTAGTTTIVVTQIYSHSTSAVSTEIPGNDDSIFWKSSTLFSLPANILVLRPSHFANERGAVVAMKGGLLGQQCRIAGGGQPLRNVLSMAYLASPVRMILPPDAPQGRFDFLITLPATNQQQQIERLQSEITRQLRLVGHKETIETNVLLLQVANANGQGLKPHAGQDSTEEDQAGKRYLKGQDISTLAGSVEYALNQPVIDDTGMQGRYDFVLDEKVFNGNTSREEIGKTLMDQFGLELVPTNMPIEMLVIEKAN